MVVVVVLLFLCFHLVLVVLARFLDFQAVFRKEGLHLLLLVLLLLLLVLPHPFLQEAEQVQRQLLSRCLLQKVRLLDFQAVLREELRM